MVTYLVIICKYSVLLYLLFFRYRLLFCLLSFKNTLYLTTKKEIMY